jgi:acyl transferase domain-containing protein/NAD(P)-dependent dehydrogenase (short-subunit alcohol dehydrogenase family)/acyl carrier protein
MQDTAHRAIAIVGTGAIMPDAPNVTSFWKNVKAGRDSITEVSPDRWDPALYYHPDHSAPDKTYSKIGGWVREYPWDPFQWRLAIPPRVADAMDGAQRWAIACTREALADYGYPERPLNTERAAVILGNAMAGEMHYFTALRAFFPEYERELDQCASFAALPASIRGDIAREWHARVGTRLPPITEDTMPGELANCLAGRIANIYNFRGPNFTCDAACASAMAAIRTAAEGLIQHDFDVALTGGIDRNMGASTFIKFCKIGALSGTGSRPYAEGADGFVMGEGAALFLIKRLEDAEREGDNIYAVIRGIGASSDGKGKGITAPNPAGQKLAVTRAWQNAGVPPHTATLIEGHGTSTSVGDVVEVESIAAVLKESGANGHSIALGSVKSNIGHLKGASGAAGILKTALALRDKILPPSVHCERPNPNIDFAHSPLAVNTELRPWNETCDGVRRAGVSAFGFGGTNFHVVMEEYVPHRLTSDDKRRVSVQIPEPQATHRGAFVAGAVSEAALIDRLHKVHADAKAGHTPPRGLPAEADLRAPMRLAIDYADAAELADKTAKALKAFEANQPAMWKALQAQGVFRGQGPAPKVAFLYPGQGSQYVNMLQELRAREPIVAQTFAEADHVMTPLLGKPLSDYIFIDGADPAAVAKLEEDLRQTAITQPAVLASDFALTLLLDSYGIRPDMTMGHSLGEYGALVAAGALPFADALEAVSARGREMTRVAMDDNGRMAAVFAPLDEIETILKRVDGYVVIANINSEHQAVIGGHTKAIGQAVAAFRDAGYEAVELPVSHAFHTSVVAPASEPMRRVLARLHLQSPRVPTVANVDGEFYPMGPDVVPHMLDVLARQIASPVQFVKGLHTLYAAGARIFIEVGPKKALHGFVEDVLGGTGQVMSIFTNHPKSGDVVSFNQALCGMYAWGLGKGQPAAHPDLPPQCKPDSASRPVVITGAALGLPGDHHIFDDANVERLLRGDQFIDVIPTRFRRAMLDKHITRLVKNDNGGNFETITDAADVLKLAGRGGPFDLTSEFGIPADRVVAMDRTTRLAIAAGLDALRDAGIPLVMHYKKTTTGAQLPDRWGLPDSLRDDTGVIFASVFPGFDSFAGEAARYYQDRSRREQLATLESLRARISDPAVTSEIDRRIAEFRAAIEKEPYVFDRRFLFHVLSMGHSQFAELIGARGPNTQLNAACATTTQAVGVAEDWIAAGRCRRVIIVSADDVSSDNLLEWFGAGFLASGAAATDDVVENAAVPFDRRRHGMIVGMGAAAIVVERADAAAERGLRPICEVLSAVTANSAFHGTRLDPTHIAGVMESLVTRAEHSSGVSRQELAKRMVFVSHETYTPARGGSASAEIHALRKVFDGAADSIVIANTKGFTGHAMGVGIEDVLAVKALETGSVPPVANFKEVDPELGPLNLSRGGAYPVEYSLRLGAGFGSQISMTILRRLAPGPERPAVANLGYAYRIADPAAWQSWLRTAAGGPAELEVAHRTLRIRDARQPNAAPPPAEPIELHVPKPAPLKVAAPVAENSLRDKVLAIVAEKTGYPIEMLALDLDLEADLGIDTVKQAEMFAAVRETFGIPRDPNLKLRDFPTLAHVLRFAEERGTTQLAPAPAPAPGSTTRDKVLAIVAEKTGYPIEMLALDLDLEADLGIDTVKQAEMFAAVRETFGIPRDPNLKLRDFPTLAHVMQFAGERGGGTMRPADPAPARADAPPPAPTPATKPENPIRDKVLAIVAEKTGYPIDMLDPDLDLEADLGIDTVKQAEMFASVRQVFGIARDTNMKLREFPTLGHVIRFAEERSAALQPPPSHAPVPPPEPVAEIPTPGVARRIPVPVLRPPLTLCRPTAVPLEPGRRVLVVADQAGAGQALASRLRSLGVEVLDQPDGHTLHGIYWLAALDPEGPLDDWDLSTWREALRLRVKSLYSLMRERYEQIAQPGTFLITGTRLGGKHGYDEAGACSPLGGAVTGFAKAFKRERPDALVKTVDFEPAASAADIAELLIEETLRDPTAVEIGYCQSNRWTVGMEERPFNDGRPGIPLGKDTVFLITGAAGSIVSAITADLAAASGGTFHLLDLTPAPQPGDPDLQRLATDREALKRDIFARLQAQGHRATPALVEKEIAALERAEAASQAIHAVEAAGGAAHYYSVDLTNGGAVAAVMDQIRSRSGRIDVLLHAAGIERSHFLPDKDPREFDLVFDVKSDGWFNLMRGLRDMPPQAIVAFSSIAGRFGNGGQTDYSAANDLLCKLTSSFRTTHPETRAIAIDWTAWAGIGMASRGSIPQMMKFAGIDMLPPETGVPWIRRELTAGAGKGEVVVAGELGILLLDPSGSRENDVAVAVAGPMLDRMTAIDRNGVVTFESTLDPKIQPFLYDHQIDATPVLPGVMGIEAFAEAAKAMAPEWQVASVEDMAFLAPFKFYRHEPRTLTVEAAFRQEAADLIAECRLLGRRTLPNGAEPQVTTHFTGRVRLTRAVPVSPGTLPLTQGDGPVIEAADIYQVYFHGPAYRVIRRAWCTDTSAIGEMSGDLPVDHQPGAQPLAVVPRLIELCFQTAGLWEMSMQHRMGLPWHVERVSFYKAPQPGDVPIVFVTPSPARDSFAADVVDRDGNPYLRLTGYGTIAFLENIDAGVLRGLESVRA